MCGRDIADRARRAMRRREQSGTLGKRCDLFQLQHAAAELHIRHDDVHRLGLYIRKEALDAQNEFAAGRRHLRFAIDGGKILDRGRGRHLLQPVQLQVLHSSRQFQAALQIKMAVDVDQEIYVGTDPLAHGFGTGDPAAGELLDDGSIAEIARHLIERRQLYCVKAIGYGTGSHIGEALRSPWISGAVDIGILANALLNTTSEQIVCGYAKHFAPNVPQTLLESGHGDRSRQLTANGFRHADAAKVLDLVNASTFHLLEESSQEVEHAGIIPRDVARLGGVADTGDAGAGLESCDQPIPALVDLNANGFESGDGDLGRTSFGSQGCYGVGRERETREALEQDAPAKIHG